jgi:hypothetical protein
LKVLLDTSKLIKMDPLFEGFANSAPDWMLINHCSKGRDGSIIVNIPEFGKHTMANSNLSSDYEQAYADYLATIIAHFANQYGIIFRSVEPFNEPSSSAWAPVQQQQEGMHVAVDQQQRVIQDVYTALQQQGDYGTYISAADENDINQSVSDLSQYNQTTLADLGQINTHSYNGTNMTGLYAANQQNGFPLWMSEYTTNGQADIPADLGLTLGVNPCAGPEDGGASQAMDAAFWLSCRITNDINIMHARAWVYWQAVETGDNYGLLQTGLDKNSSCFTQPASSPAPCFAYTKQFFALWQYSHFIRPGYQIIGIANDGLPQSLAAFDPVSHTVVIVTTNNTMYPLHVSYDLAQFAHVAGPITAYRTSPTENGQQIAAPTPIPSGHFFSADARPDSITTYVVSGVDSPYLNNIDWANTTYPVGPCSGNSQLVTVQNGQGTDSFFKVAIASSSTAYGDLTGSGQPASVVLLTCIGADAWNDAVVYTGNAAHPSYLGDLLRSSPLLSKITSVTMNQSTQPATLVLHGVGGGPACCPSNKVILTLRWNGSQFVVVKQEQIPIKIPSS